MRFSDISRSSGKELDTEQTRKRRPTNEMYNGNYGYGNQPVTSESRFPRDKKRREGGISDISFKLVDRVPRHESGTQDHMVSSARIDGMRRKKEDIERGIDMAGRAPARGRREYRLNSSEAGSDAESKGDKLTSEEWNALDTKLSEVEDAYHKYKGENYNNFIAYKVAQSYKMEELGTCIQEEKARRETAVNDLLDKFRKAVDAHLENYHGDDYSTLNDLLNDIPANVENADFMLSLRICDGVIRTGKGE